MKYAVLVVFSILALTLGACGGGGGGSTVVTPPVPVTGAVIESANAEMIAGRSANAVFQTSSFGNVTNSAGLTLSGPGGVSKLSAPGSGAAQVPIGPEVTPCAVSGSVTITGDVANPTTITPGDFVDIDWDNCDEGTGPIIDWLTGMTFTDVEGDLLSGLTFVGLALNVDNFQVSEGSVFNRADGDMMLSLDARTPPLVISTWV